jgi:hypothetical protein
MADPAEAFLMKLARFTMYLNVSFFTPESSANNRHSGKFLR